MLYKFKGDVANAVIFCFPILLKIQPIKTHYQMFYGTLGPVLVGSKK